MNTLFMFLNIHLFAFQVPSSSKHFLIAYMAAVLIHSLDFILIN